MVSLRLCLRGAMAAVLVVGVGVGTVAAQPVSSEHSHFGVGLKAGTLGIGVDVAVPLAHKLNVRAGVTTFSLNHDFDSDGITLAAKLKLRSFDTHLDWFPFGGGFHLSPGLVLYNGTEVDATASIANNKQFTLGNDDLYSNPANPVKGTATVGFAHVAPSILFGWGNLVPRGNRRWAVQLETGVIYSRQPNLVLALTGSACTSPNGTGNCRDISTDPQLKQDVQDQQDKVNKDLNVLKAFPVVSFGFSYKF